MARPGQPRGPQSLGRRSLFVQGMAVAGALVLGDWNSEAFASEGGPVSLTDANVDLTIDSTKSSFAVGTIGGRPAVFKGSPYGGVVSGSMLGTSFGAEVAQKDQVPQGSNFVTTTKVSGAFGPVATTLLGTFTVGPDFLFETGTITGESARKLVKVLVLPKKDLETSSAVTVAGQFGDTKFSLVAVIPVASRGSLSGTVSSQSVRLDIAPLKSDQLSIRLTGNYSGPSDFLALIVGAVSYFGG
jgi:hypothetical protein